MLFGVSAYDPLTFAAIAALLALVAGGRVPPPRRTRASVDPLRCPQGRVKTSAFFDFRSAKNCQMRCPCPAQPLKGIRIVYAVFGARLKFAGSPRGYCLTRLSAKADRDGAKSRNGPSGSSLGIYRGPSVAPPPSMSESAAQLSVYACPFHRRFGQGLPRPTGWPRSSCPRRGRDRRVVRTAPPVRCRNTLISRRDACATYL